MSGQALTPEEIKAFAHNVWVGDLILRNLVAATAFIVYDWLVTLADEVEHFWSSRWKRGSWKFVVYLIVRYYPLLVQALSLSNAFLVIVDPFTASACRAWFIFRTVSLTITTASVQFILAIQVSALYNRHRLVIALLSALWSAHVLIAFAIFVPYMMRTVTFDALTCQPSPGELGGVHRISAILLAMSFLVQIVLSALTALKTVDARRQGWGRNAALVTLIMRDGTWAFLLATLGAAGTMITVLTGSVWQSVVFPWFQSVLSLIGSHLLLNMAAVRPASSEPGVMLTTHLSSIGAIAYDPQ